MNTDPRHPTADGATPPQQRVDWWVDTINRINTWWVHRQPAGPAILDWARTTPRHVVATVAALAGAVTLGAVTVIVWLASAVYGLISAAAADGRDTAISGGRWMAAWHLTRVITEPVHAYLADHAAALHTTGDLLWTGWLATTGALFALAVLGCTGARIGWTLAGALTTTVIYTATPTDARTVAAGIAVTAWSLLSVAAFNRVTGGRRGPDITIITHADTSTTANDGHERAARDSADS